MAPLEDTISDCRDTPSYRDSFELAATGKEVIGYGGDSRPHLDTAQCLQR